MDKKLFLQLAGIFLLTQSLGLMVASSLISEQVQAKIITDNPEDFTNVLGLAAYIGVITVIILVVIRYYKGVLLFKVLEALAVLAAGFVALASLLPDLIALVLVGLLVLSRFIWVKNIWVRNVATMITIMGAGALIGVSVSLWPIILFIVLLAAYDFIAVFWTKHMGAMAKALTERNLAFTCALPTKKHRFELGAGDLVMPLVVSSSVLKFFPGSLEVKLAVAVSVLAASFIGLNLTLMYSEKHIGKALPALPLQGIGMVLVVLAAKGLALLF